MDYIGKICPFCKTVINEGDEVIVCPACNIPHHKACWEENKGCTTFGCSQQNYQAQGTNPTSVCTNCGAAMGDGQMFCPQCGTAKAAPAPQKSFCSQCGAELMPGQEFCAQCGQKAAAPAAAPVPPVGTVPPVNPAFNQYNPVMQPAPKKNKTGLIIGIVAAVVVVLIAIVVLGGGAESGPDFDAIYDQYCVSTWADVGSDGSYLSVDTNPFDNDDDGLAYPAAYTAVKNINNALELPESLFNDMGQTTGADGKQFETFEEQGVSVSWKYHPDTGLEVTYKKLS